MNDTIRICVMRDGPCPHGLDCPFVGDGPMGYPCKDGWRTRYLTPQERATLSEAFRTSGKLVAVLSLPERENPPAIKDSGRAL